MTQNEEQFYSTDIDTSEENNNSFELVDINHNTSIKKHMLVLNKTLRTVPNILKNNSKLHSILEKDATETDCSSKNLTNIDLQNSFKTSNQILSENIYVNKEIENKRISHRRKQELGFMNLWQDLPNSDTSSLANDKNEMLDKHSHASVLKKRGRKKKLKEFGKKEDDKLEESMCKQKKERSKEESSVADNVITDITSECQLFSFGEEIESADLQDSVDYTSNEIFNKFNYEFYDNSNSICIAWNMQDPDETVNCLNTTYENDIYEKEYETIYKEFELWKEIEYLSPEEAGKGNKQDKGNISSRRFVFSEPRSEDLPFFNDKKEKSDSCCGYCSKYCVPSWIPNRNIHHSFKGDILLAVTLNDSQDDWDICDLYGKMTDDNSNEYNNGTTCSPTCENDNILQNIDEQDSSLPLFINYSNEEVIEREIFKQPTYIQEECNAFNSSGTEIECDGISLISEERVEKFFNADAFLIKKQDTKNEDFRCLSCPLTFPNPRRMAMHKAGAHGGLYVMLCEICGTLFNRKYHFNRHLLHCRMGKLYSCDICTRKYRHKSTLVKHLKSSHRVPPNENDTMKFNCNVCDKVYARFGALENHKRAHLKKIQLKNKRKVCKKRSNKRKSGKSHLRKKIRSKG